jgi:hypothetical protein
MIAEIKSEIASGNYELDDLRDNSAEWIDGYLPVYYNRIIEEWQNMPSEYNNRGYAELGGEVNIFSLMSSDLYLYYSDLFTEALNEVKSYLENYAFSLEGGGVICPKCADNPLYEGEIERENKEGYPDGYTCSECGTVIL